MPPPLTICGGELTPDSGPRPGYPIYDLIEHTKAWGLQDLHDPGQQQDI